GGRAESNGGRTQSDHDVEAVRAEYEGRRDPSQYSADDQWELARWAQEEGMTAGALAHDKAGTRIDPTRDAAWKKLGCRKFEGRWMTPAQVDQIRADREAQAKADKHWQVVLEKWKDWLANPRRKAEAEAGLLGVNDPRAV